MGASELENIFGTNSRGNTAMGRSLPVLGIFLSIEFPARKLVLYKIMTVPFGNLPHPFGYFETRHVLSDCFEKEFLPCYPRKTEIT